MDKIQAETKAAGWSKMANHPLISYKPVELDPTKWERKRFGVAQMLDGHVVGIAAS